MRKKKDPVWPIWFCTVSMLLLGFSVGNLFGKRQHINVVQKAYHELAQCEDERDFLNNITNVLMSKCSTPSHGSTNPTNQL